MRVQAGSEHADRLYLVLGSLSGAAPGLQLTPSVHLPLVPDLYFFVTVNSANSGALVETFGTHDAEGVGVARLDVPENLGQALAGATFSHAAVVLDAVSLVVESATVPASLTILRRPMGIAAPPADSADEPAPRRKKAGGVLATVLKRA